MKELTPVSRLAFMQSDVRIKAWWRQFHVRMCANTWCSWLLFVLLPVAG